MPWEKGQSGNKKGRPPKSRALTALLERAGKKKTAGGKTSKQEMADRIWEALATGMITYPSFTEQVVRDVVQPDGKKTAVTVEVERTPRIFLEAPDFIALAKLVLSQIDGPPPAAVDVTSAGEQINPTIVIHGIASRSEPPSLDDLEDDSH